MLLLSGQKGGSDERGVASHRSRGVLHHVQEEVAGVLVALVARTFLKVLPAIEGVPGAPLRRGQTVPISPDKRSRHLAEGLLSRVPCSWAPRSGLLWTGGSQVSPTFFRADRQAGENLTVLLGGRLPLPAS